LGRSLKARIQQGKDLKARILDFAAVERARRRQSSRIAWLKDGDACTHFFHLCANARQQRNYIPAWRKPDQSLVYYIHRGKRKPLSLITSTTL
jgi:hypothetical protein